MASNEKTIEFYEAQAAACRLAASEATLGNVRDSSIRAAESWDDLAERTRQPPESRVLPKPDR